MWLLRGASIASLVLLDAWCTHTRILSSLLLFSSQEGFARSFFWVSPEASFVEGGSSSSRSYLIWAFTLNHVVKLVLVASGVWLFTEALTEPVLEEGLLKVTL